MANFFDSFDDIQYDDFYTERNLFSEFEHDTIALGIAVKLGAEVA